VDFVFTLFVPMKTGTNTLQMIYEIYKFTVNMSLHHLVIFAKEFFY